MKIGDSVVLNPGESARFTIKVGEWADGTAITMPVLAVRGQSDGPVLWLNGLVHGDEINGAVVAVKAINAIDPQKLHGAVVCTPVSNPLAYLARQRISFTDNLDIDQQFPGAAGGITTQRIAHRLFSLIKANATHAISFHSVGAPMNSVAYAVFKRVPTAKSAVVRDTARMALAFGTRVACMVDVATATGELPGQLEGSLDLACIDEGIPCFMAEVGGGARLQDESTAIGVRGVRNVMGLLGMLPHEKAASAGVESNRVVVTKRRFFIADQGGLWETSAKPMEIVREGQRFGTISNWFGEATELRAPQDLCIILLRANPPVHEGDRLAFVGTEWMPAEKFETSL